jgi:two-component sensor histidine kinase
MITKKPLKNAKKINFKLNLNLYNLNSIKHAIKDYKGIARISLKSNEKNYLELTLKTTEDIPNIEHEFTNYVLGIMKN